jgi:hypothetical protein
MSRPLLNKDDALINTLILTQHEKKKRKKKGRMDGFVKHPL